MTIDHLSRPSRRIAALVGLLAVTMLTLGSSPASAQRVQIPVSPQPTFAPSGAPAWGTPNSAPLSPPVYTPNLGAPAFNPYGTAATLGGVPPAPASSIYGAPPVHGTPYAPPYPTQAYPPAAPAYSAPSLSTSPYGSPVVTGAPAYDYSAPPAPTGFSSEGNPIGWQPGTYGFQQADGGTVRFRQFLARLRGEHTVLLGDNTADALELNRLELASTFAFPVAGMIEEPLLITPGFAFNWFAGPEGDPAAMPRGPDLPPLVYDAYVDFAWYPRFGPTLGAELGFRTGVWTDFKEVNSDSMRYLGRGLGVVTVSPQFEFLLGAVFLDRLRVKMLPAGGVRWRPTPEWDLYLVFPNPKIRRMLSTVGGADWWWYVGGEYGGGSWTVDRAGMGDRIDYNDLRLSLGFEWQTPSQLRGHLEVGYAFDRELLFNEGLGPARAKLDDAVMFRAGIGY